MTYLFFLSQASYEVRFGSHIKRPFFSLYVSHSAISYRQNYFSLDQQIAIKTG